MLKASVDIPKMVEVDEVCPNHGIRLKQMTSEVGVVIGRDENEGAIKEFRKAPPFCEMCIQEENKAATQKAVTDNMNAARYANTYNILMRDSTIPKELKSATFDNFITNTEEEKQLLEFAKSQVQKYLDGMNGNTLLTGTTGVGKTHLAISLAKELNEAYRAKGEPKSVLFINLTEILREIRESFKFTSKEGYYSRMLKEVDYLILDDLGVKLGNASGQSKSAWEEEFIFDVLSHRNNTIITTNLSNNEIANLYSERVASRVRTGLEGNYFKVFSIKDKRYSINKLKSMVQ
ncbi:TPA: ATP-binding protein [Streptococcus suis]|nr:ATP-binding protein [Streptococcus suis]